MTNGKKKCQFTAEYHDYESQKRFTYNCPDDEEIPGSGLCMFHDGRYLQDEDNNKEQSVRDGLDAKIRQSVDQKEPLFCIGYHLPGIIIRERNFTKPVYFSECEFQGLADFFNTSFQGQADFSSVFNAKTFFNNVLFEDGKKILFETEDLSKVSFANTDITRVRFIETARWGEGKKDKDRFKVIEERNLEESPEDVKNLGSIMAVYRNLRENYEFRLRYDEAGKFFIREMELKRNYREKLSPDGNKTIVKRNGWLRRNLSLTGLYYHLSRYGENLLRPTLLGIAIVFGSTLFWLIQTNPNHEPSLSHIVGLSQMRNSTQWQKAFERSFSDFLPLLPQGSDVKVGIPDFIIKIVGGALTFGLLAVALRRKFERKYTR